MQHTARQIADVCAPSRGRDRLVPLLSQEPEMNALVGRFTQLLTVPLLWITGAESPDSYEAR